MAAGKGSDLAAIAATGHGTPAAALCARDVIEKQTARRIGAGPQACARAFRNNFRRGTRDGGKQPIETALSGNEFQTPNAIALEKFVMAFGHTQDFVQGLNPIAAEDLFAEHTAE